jgi:hypothetical protein
MMCVTKSKVFILFFVHIHNVMFVIKLNKQGQNKGHCIHEVIICECIHLTIGKRKKKKSIKLFLMKTFVFVEYGFPHIILSGV